MISKFPQSNIYVRYPYQLDIPVLAMEKNNGVYGSLIWHYDFFRLYFTWHTIHTEILL